MILNKLLLGLSLSIMPLLAETLPEDCSKELLLSYFPESFLNKTLSQFKVPENEWTAINQELATKDRDVVKLVEEKASEITPNPLKDPQQRSTAIKIFKDSLYEVFASVMEEHGITDQNKIQAMLDDIRNQRAQRFAKCLKENPK